MKVFISWSGEQSKQVALALRDWLPMVTQAVWPYMSDLDTEAGVRWLDTVSNALEEANFGIICVTPENVNSRWLNFEAGAISKAVDKSRVVPLLYDFPSLAELPPPLSQFQAKMADEKGIKSVVTTINALIDNNPRSESQIAGVFRALWPALEAKLKEIDAAQAVDSSQPHRRDRELLEEILQLTRDYEDRRYYEGTTIPMLMDAEQDERRYWLMSELRAHFGMRSVAPMNNGGVFISGIDRAPRLIYRIGKALDIEVVAKEPNDEPHL